MDNLYLQAITSLQSNTLIHYHPTQQKTHRAHLKQRNYTYTKNIDSHKASKIKLSNLFITRRSIRYLKFEHINIIHTLGEAK